MATYTKGFVITENKDVFLVAKAVMDAVRAHQKSLLESFPRIGQDQAVEQKRSGLYSIDFEALKGEEKLTPMDLASAWPNLRLRVETKGISVDFVAYSYSPDEQNQVKRENRSLSVFFETDCDRLEYGEKSLSFLMGDYGCARELMPKVVTEVGRTVNGMGYFLESDASDQYKPEVVFEPDFAPSMKP